MKNTSITSVLGFLLSLPVVVFVFIYATNSLGRDFGGLGLIMLGLVAASLSTLFSLISLIYVLKGSSGKYLTFFALAVDVIFFIIFSAIQASTI